VYKNVYVFGYWVYDGNGNTENVGREWMICEYCLEDKENDGICEECNIEIDMGENICGNCIDDTEGRNQHFWQIKKEINESRS
jgi:predicted amidophosphoribosyltransferase